MMSTKKPIAYTRYDDVIKSNMCDGYSMSKTGDKTVNSVGDVIFDSLICKMARILHLLYTDHIV